MRPGALFEGSIEHDQYFKNEIGSVVYEALRGIQNRLQREYS